MDLVTLTVDVVIALWVVAVVVGIVRAIKARPPRLAPLPEQIRNRFEVGWERISGRFLYEPQWAVGEADSLVMSLLSARGQPLDHAPTAWATSTPAGARCCCSTGRSSSETSAQSLVGRLPSRAGKSRNGLPRVFVVLICRGRQSC